MGSIEVASPPRQPDIGYTPDLDKYLARVKRRTTSEALTKSLPPGFPTNLESDLVWDGQKVEKEYNWTYEVSAVELEDIENALQHFKCKSLPNTPPRNLHPNGPSISSQSVTWPHQRRDLSIASPASSTPQDIQRTSSRSWIRRPERASSHQAHPRRKHHHIRGCLISCCSRTWSPGSSI